MRLILPAAFGLLACLLASPGMAQGFSSSDWTVGGRTVQLRVTLPESLVRPLVGTAMPIVTNQALASYVLAHVDVHAANAACPPIDQQQGIGLIDTFTPQPGEFRYEIIFECPQTVPLTAALRLDNHILFGRAPAHVDFARLRSAGHATVTRFFDAAHQSITLRPDAALRNASPFSYAAIGLRHLLASVVRVGCMLALLAPLRRRADWIGVAAALAGGYALSVGLGLTGGFAPRPQAAEVMIGLLALLLCLRGNRYRTTIAAAVSALLLVLAAVEVLDGHVQARLMLGAAILAPSLLLSGRRWVWLIPPALLGLLDGAAFTDAVHGLYLPGWGAASPLCGYAAGGFLAAAALAALAAWPIRKVPASLAALGSGAFACYSVVWFATHIHG